MENNRVSKPRTSKSDSKVLVKNASEYEKMMDLAFENAIYSQVSHNGHIALELLLKAIHAKSNGGEHPFGHDLQEIIEKPLNSSDLFREIQSADLKNMFDQVCSAWDMQHRYLSRSTQKEDAESLLKAYKEVIKWTRTRYEK